MDRIVRIYIAISPAKVQILYQLCKKNAKYFGISKKNTTFAAAFARKHLHIATLAQLVEQRIRNA